MLEVSEQSEQSMLVHPGKAGRPTIAFFSACMQGQGASVLGPLLHVRAT
jgi:hypothetical protein